MSATDHLPEVDDDDEFDYSAVTHAGELADAAGLEGWVYEGDFPPECARHLVSEAIAINLSRRRGRPAPTPAGGQPWAPAEHTPAISTGRALRANGAPAVLPEPTSAIDRHAASLIDWEALWAKEHTDDDWLLEPVLPRGRGVSVVAKAKTEKSLLMLYLTACLAAGREVLRRPSGPPVHVMYVDMEMTEDDVLERLTEMGFTPGELGHLHYHLLPSISMLDTPVGGAEVVELALHHQVELVVVDTLSRVIVGAENDADTLRNFYAYTGRPLKAHGIGCCRLDHLGKDAAKGGRGTSAKADDVDVVWEITRRDKDQLDLKATHKRMSWVPAVTHLQRVDDPLRYRMVDDTWPAGTAEAAAKLAAAEVPLDAGRNTARKMLVAAGVTPGKNDVLAAALRYRRSDIQGPA